MNGRTSIDATMNPCSADMDRHTYGFKWLNFSTHGKRLFCLSILGCCLDVYRGGNQFFSVRGGNWITFFSPYGCLTLPMPRRHR